VRLPIPPPGQHKRKPLIKDYTIKKANFTTQLPISMKESSRKSEVEGIVQAHRDGHGFVLSETDAPDIYLPSEEMRAVMHGDRLRVSLTGTDRRGRPEGRVMAILERRKRPIIGRLLCESGTWLLAPEDNRFSQDIQIEKNSLGTAQVGQVVSVELLGTPSLHTQPIGRILEVLGEVDDPGMEIEIAVRKYEVPHLFCTQALEEAAALPEKIRAIDRRGRIDLTDVPLVTIDGEDARDFDDAVYCEPIQLGRGKKAISGWRLVVAIADVSHYVKPGKALDMDAFERATSVYFPRRVIPMLPEKISNGLCSLNPHQDRLCMVCDMVVDEAGEVVGYQFYPAVMCSHARLTYTEVGAALTNSRGLEANRLQNLGLMTHLLHLHEVYRALLKRRSARGAIDFESTETQIVCDANGRIERIVPRTRNEAHRLIEEAMLAANVCAADFIESADHPALFRVHEGPTPEKRVTLQNYLRALGLGLSVSDTPKPAEFQAISQAVRDRPDAQQIQLMLLRSMQQAIYTAVNSGHFGLAYEAYAHFTSPIRRYPDLLVHRVIKAILQGKRYRLKCAAGDGQAKLLIPKIKGAAGGSGVDQEQWELAGAQCSAFERRADEASRDVEAWLKCRYMRDRLGEEFAGTVSAVTGFGLFVQLDELYVEGLVHITELGSDYYRFDEVRQELRGERTGVRFTVGSLVHVQVTRVDLDGRKIDFCIVQGNSANSTRQGTSSTAKKGQCQKTAKKAASLVTKPQGVVSVNAQEALDILETENRAARSAARKAVGQTAGKSRRASHAANPSVKPAGLGKKAKRRG